MLTAETFSIDLLYALVLLSDASGQPLAGFVVHTYTGRLFAELRAQDGRWTVYGYKTGAATLVAQVSAVEVVNKLTGWTKDGTL